MGWVQQAVLEFDEEVRAPWRPRLVSVPAGEASSARPPLAHPSRRSPSRVGVCRPPAAPVRPVDAVRQPGPVRPASLRPEGRVVVQRPADGRPVRERRVAPQPPATGRLRLTRRARRLAVVLAMAVGIALGSWLTQLVDGGSELRLAGGSSVVVQPGDTLWSIASAVADGADVRAVVDELQELNDLDGGVLLPGQTLLLP